MVELKACFSELQASGFVREEPSAHAAADPVSVFPPRGACPP